MTDKCCPLCNASFSCRNSPGCWCADLPVLKEIRPEQDCLCPLCLKKALEAGQHSAGTEGR